MGHVLYGLVRDGRAIERLIYFGAERPGDSFKPYLGFATIYRSIELGPAPNL